MGAAAEAKPLAFLPVLKVVTRPARRRPGAHSKFHTARSRRDRAAPAPRDTSPRHRHPAPPTSPARAISSRAARSDRSRADRATRGRVATSISASTDVSQSAGRLARQPHHQVEAEVVETGRPRQANRVARRLRHECSRPSRRSSSSRNDWTPKLSRLTPAARKPSSASGGGRFGVGFERDLAVGREVETLAAGRMMRRDFRRLEQRRRAAAEEDGVGGDRGVGRRTRGCRRPGRRRSAASGRRRGVRD